MSSGEGATNGYQRGVFIVGCQRSGTTLMRMMLNAHPKLCSGEETFFLADMEKIITGYWPHLETYGIPKSEILNKVRNFYLSFHNMHCKQSGKTIWIEKTPAYLFHIDFIKELFPQAKIICLVRDGFDVVASFREKWGVIGFYRALWQWPESIKEMRCQQEKMADRFLHVRYEELVASPESEMRRVIKFIGVDWDESVMEHEKTDQRTRQGFGADRPLSKVNSKRVGSWKNRLAWYEKVLARLAFSIYRKELGYSDTASKMSAKINPTIMSFARIMQKYLSWRKNNQGRRRGGESHK